MGKALLSLSYCSCYTLVIYSNNIMGGITGNASKPLGQSGVIPQAWSSLMPQEITKEVGPPAETPKESMLSPCMEEQGKRQKMTGRHFNADDHRGLSDLEIYVLQFGKKDPHSAESLAIRLIILELMWIHRLRSTPPLGLNVFD